MKKDPRDLLIKQVFLFFIGEKYEEDLKRYFRQWAKKNNYPMPKMIRLISNNFAYNDYGDIVAVVHECDKNLYYNDSCNRYCYIEKSAEGSEFEYI